MTSVAFLGLGTEISQGLMFSHNKTFHEQGTVGYAMARNVAKVATQLTVWNRTVEKVGVGLWSVTKFCRQNSKFVTTKPTRPKPLCKKCLIQIMQKHLKKL